MFLFIYLFFYYFPVIRAPHSSQMFRTVGTNRSFSARRRVLRSYNTYNTCIVIYRHLTYDLRRETAFFFPRNIVWAKYTRAQFKEGLTVVMSNRRGCRHVVKYQIDIVFHHVRACGFGVKLVRRTIFHPHIVTKSIVFFFLLQVRTGFEKHFIDTKGKRFENRTSMSIWKSGLVNW